jgi:hypothetical protein
VVREALSSVTKGILYRSPTGVEQKAADGLIRYSGLIPPVFDETAARMIGGIDRVLVLTGVIKATRSFPPGSVDLSRENERIRSGHLEQYAGERATDELVLVGSQR